jgi:hypothetical protein
MSQLLETAAGYQGNSGDLNAQFAAAAANNLTVVRMFGFGVASGFQLQYSPGSYNERAFQAFDKVPGLHALCHVITHGSGACTAPCSILLQTPLRCASISAASAAPVHAGGVAEPSA